MCAIIGATNRTKQQTSCLHTLTEDELGMNPKLKLYFYSAQDLHSWQILDLLDLRM